MALKPVTTGNSNNDSLLELKGRLISYLNRIPDRKFDLAGSECDFFFYDKNDLTKTQRDARFVFLKGEPNSSDVDVCFTRNMSFDNYVAFDNVVDMYGPGTGHNFIVVCNKMKDYFEKQLADYVDHLEKRFGGNQALTPVFRDGMIDAFGYFAGANSYTIEETRSAMCKYFKWESSNHYCFQRLDMAFANGIVGDEKQKIDKSRIVSKKMNTGPTL